MMCQGRHAACANMHVRCKQDCLTGEGDCIRQLYGAGNVLYKDRASTSG